ncbi:hypothetical protein [Citrobacter braakii]|uniref:hypothetical protein n=1 Tax=Citrobacter braakii TaxID=57706 RepID=UPI00379472E2
MSMKPTYEQLEQQLAVGRKNVTKSFIAPEISVKKARRAVELLSQANISEEGVITVEGLALAEV